MKNEVRYIETKSKKIPMCFNLNVMEELQELYGSMSAWGEAVEGSDTGEPKIKDLKAGLLAMVNEAIDIENEENNTNQEPLTEKQLGRVISEVGFTEIVKNIKELTIASTKTGEETKNE